MIRYMISDGSYPVAPEGWLARAERWFAEGLELFQIREPGLNTRDLAEVTRKVVGVSRDTRIIVNDRADVALACGADGVHLKDGSPCPDLFARPGFLVTAACHDPSRTRYLAGADFVVLAPIFKPLSKADQRPVLGIEGIREFVRNSSIPVLALGGITKENARACVDAGAAGIAGITYFEQ